MENIKGLIGFLESKYAVKAYIDSWDPTMPSTTCGATAKQLKNRIETCDKFILVNAGEFEFLYVQFKLLNLIILPFHPWKN